MNKALKEPSELVFFVGGVYECTMNDPRGRFMKYQRAYMLDLPSVELVLRFGSIAIWIAPAATIHLEFDQTPSREYFIEQGWSEVYINTAQERLVSFRGGVQAKRLQYALKHIGAITINKSQGATLPFGIAIEISEEYSPWEKAQIVVATSRSNVAPKTIIVGDKTFAINKVWELITIGNQWSRYIEHVLKLITVNKHASDESNIENEGIFDYPEVYPFRVCDIINIPTDKTGYVYCLIPTMNPSIIYIGETECLTQRMMQHNSGNGSQFTQDIQNRLWAVAAYICGLGHMSTSDRMSIERTWKRMVLDLQRRGQHDTFSWINAGS